MTFTRMPAALVCLIALLGALPALPEPTRTFSIMDKQGFEAPIAAMTVEVPAGWSASGEVVWVKPCSGNEHFELVFTAQSPDGRSGFRIMPGHQLLWVQAVPTGFPPDLAQMMLAQSEAELNRLRTQFRDSNCHVARLTGGTDQLLRALVLDKRPPGTRVVGSEPLPAMIDNYRALFGGAAAPGMRNVFDAREVTMTYELRGGPVEERLLFGWYMFQIDPPSQGPGTFVQHAIVESLRTTWIAPERRVADEAQVKALVTSMRATPEWNRRIDDFYATLRRLRQQEAADRDVHRQQQEAIRDQQHQQFIQMIQQ